MSDHDSGYKLLFSHPDMVRDLLQGFVNEEWVEQLDFASLEKVSGSYVADDLRDREDDVICVCDGERNGCSSICFWSFNPQWIGSCR